VTAKIVESKKPIPVVQKPAPKAIPKVDGSKYNLKETVSSNNAYIVDELMKSFGKRSIAEKSKIKMLAEDTILNNAVKRWIESTFRDPTGETAMICAYFVQKSSKKGLRSSK